MTNIWAPISFRDRDRAFAKMVRRGHATHREMLDAAFGQDITTIKGIEIVAPPEGVMHFKPIGSDPELNPIDYLISLAYVRDNQSDTIYINRLMMNPLGQIGGITTSRLFLARLHEFFDLFATAELRHIGLAFAVAGLVTTFRFAMVTAVTKMVGMSLADEISEEQVHALDLKDPNASTMTQSFQALAKDAVLSKSQFSQSVIGMKRAADMLFTLMPLSSWTLDREMEARLHLINIRNHKSWGGLPKDRTELAAALADVGVIRPKVVKQWLKKPEQRELLKRFSNYGVLDFNGLLSAPVAELNIGLNAAHDEDVLRIYWDDGLPLMYARLLTKYGDKAAMERFGFDANPQNIDLAGLPMLLERGKPTMAAITHEPKAP